jgi:hypothetical protein
MSQRDPGPKREGSVAEPARARQNRKPRCGRAAHSGWRDPDLSREMSLGFLATNRLAFGGHQITQHELHNKTT